MKKRIAVDIDDVLADSTAAFCKYVNEFAGLNLELSDYFIDAPYHGYYKEVWRRHGVADKVDWDETSKQMVVDQSHVPLMQDARKVLELLRKDYDIVLVTSRFAAWEEATHRWLEEYCSGLYDSVHFSHYDNAHAETKGEICKRIGAEWLIDDNPQYCFTAIEHGVQPILFGIYGWQSGAQETFTRCQNWSEVAEFFTSISA